ncbi:MAG: sensor histidine kinase [Caldilineaceae bacterium]|nr:sensor histidine kinase [Caldilineaceae bacterium]
MPPKSSPSIFERFYRGDASRTNNGASGLGLPIAKSIIEAHGGSITVTNGEGGQGACFTISLPALQGQESRLGPNGIHTGSLNVAGGNKATP